MFGAIYGGVVNIYDISANCPEHIKPFSNFGGNF